MTREEILWINHQERMNGVPPDQWTGRETNGPENPTQYRMRKVREAQNRPCDDLAYAEKIIATWPEYKKRFDVSAIRKEQAQKGREG